MLRGTAQRHGEDDGNRARDERRKREAYERDLLEADKENEQIRAELSILESQVVVLQGALTALPRVPKARYSDVHPYHTTGDCC